MSRPLTFWPATMLALLLLAVAVIGVAIGAGVTGVEVRPLGPAARRFGSESKTYHGTIRGRLHAVGHPFRLGGIMLVILTRPTPADEAFVRAWSQPIHIPGGNDER